MLSEYIMKKKIKYLVAPNPKDKKLTEEISGFDESFKRIKTKVIIEKDLTIYLNNQEIVTLMTVGDHPKYLAVGYLLNQNMLKLNDQIKKVEYDAELKVVVVRTLRKTNYETKLKRKVTTSGCAIGTVFGDVYDEILKTKIKSRPVSKKSFSSEFIFNAISIFKFLKLSKILFNREVLLNLCKVLKPPPNRLDCPPARITKCVFDLSIINSFLT